jgi:hypothetical protein
LVTTRTKGSARKRIPRAPAGVQKGTTRRRRRRTSRANKRPWPTTLLLLLIVRNLKDPGGGIFDKMLKEPCPYHKGPTNHNLEDCHML